MARGNGWWTAPNRAAFALRLAFLLLFAFQAIHYTAAVSRERAALCRLVAERIGPTSDAEEKLMRSTAVAFAIPRRAHVPLAVRWRDPWAMILRPSAYEVYLHGGPCSGRSRLLAELLELQGIPAHKLYLYNPLGLALLKDSPRAWVHVVVEAKIGDRWVVADPLFNLVFRRTDGQLATAQDLSRDPTLLRQWRLRANERYDNWEDALYTYHDLRRFPWFVVPGIGEGIRAVLVSAMSAPQVDSWATPPWLERPPLTIAALSWAGAALIGLALVPWPWARRPRRETPAPVTLLPGADRLRTFQTAPRANHPGLAKVPGDDATATPRRSA